MTQSSKPPSDQCTLSTIRGSRLRLRAAVPVAMAVSIACSAPALALAPDESASAPEPESAESGSVAEPNAGSPEAAADEVVLKDGGFVRGSIEEVSPESHVVIVVGHNGERRTIPWSEVAEVKRGATVRPPAPQAPGISTPPTTAAPEPELGAPRIHVEVEGDGTVLLHRVVADIAGANISGVVSRAVCRAPCDEVIDGRGGESFFFGGSNPTVSRRFELVDKTGDVTARVRPGKRGLYVGGFILVGIGGTIALGGVAMLAMPRPTSALRSFKVPGAATLGTGAAMLAGGIPMMVFGRTRVKWFPGRSG